MLLASFAVAPLRKPVLERERKPLRETLVVSLEPGRSSTARGRRCWSAPRCWSPWRCRSSGCASASPTRATTPRTPPPARPTTCSPTGSGRASTARSASPPRCPPGTDPAALQAVTDAIAADPGVAFVSDPITNDEADPTAALWRVVPTTAPQDEATTDLVNRLRDDVLPAATAGTGLDVAVAGGVAIGVDFTDYLSAAAAVLLRRRARPVVPAADGRVPLAAGAAQGGRS